MQHDITITNGTGTKSLVPGAYSVTADVTGYSNTTVDPSTLNVVDGTTSYDLTIAATGTLTLHVTETGETTGTAVVGATFYRTDSSGNTYGSVITTDSSGNAIFNNVPYATTGAPIIYYKQNSSDGEHTFNDTVQSTTLTSQTATVEVTNPSAPVNTFNMTDANYENLPIDSGTLSLTS